MSFVTACGVKGCHKGILHLLKFMKIFQSVSLTSAKSMLGSVPTSLCLRHCQMDILCSYEEIGVVYGSLSLDNKQE